VGTGAVLALKLLARPPRGNTVAAFHGYSKKQMQKVQFAEQVQVGPHHPDAVLRPCLLAAVPPAV